MDDTLVLFRWTDHAFGVTGWFMVIFWFALILLYLGIRYSGRN